MKDPAFLFYSQDFYMGTRTMLPEERACYVDLLIYQHQNGFIPGNTRRVLMHCSGIDEATLMAVLEAKFKLSDEGWYNERLNREIESRKEFAKNRSVNGAIGQFWKKMKAQLTKKEYEKARQDFKSLSSEELYDILNSEKIKTLSNAEDILKAALKLSLSTRVEIEIEIEDENINKDKDKKEGVQGEKTWRDDFDVYKAELDSEYDILRSDDGFLREQQKFYPGVNIPLSLEKAYTNFWATEAGWKHKKRQKSKSLDWEKTFRNALSQPQNKVYENRNNNNTGTAAQRRRDSLDEMERDANEFLSGIAGQKY